MRQIGLILVSFIYILGAYSQSIDSVNAERVVSIKTSYGEIQAKLYNETPLHRDNFIKLIEDGFYDSLLFHRVINQFMIQGGDPDSRNAKPNKQLGNGNIGYTIPAEFRDTILHKRGSLAAAREPDNINPKKESSACQFYLVQGRVFNNEQLDQLQQRIMQNAYNQEAKEIFKLSQNDSLKNARLAAFKSNDSLQLVQVRQALDSLIMPKLQDVKFTDQQRFVYTTKGGTPHLDGAYTVFGEMISGFNVLDSIAAASTGKRDRPIEDIVFSIQLLK